MSEKLYSILSQKLKSREDNALLRKLSTSTDLIDFCSNDYLGLSINENLIADVQQHAVAHQGMKLGSGGSRLLAGNSTLAEELELFLAETHQSEAALLCNSGYAANLSLFSSIPQKGDTIIYDELSHACIKDGARLSFANRLSFKHNDLDDLKKKLQKATATGTVFIAVESVYSMDGDQAPLQDLVALAQEYQANIIVDEAHSTGLWGEKGAGLCVELGIQDHIFARIHTFGKGIGAHGACIACNEVVKNYLINFARPFIFTTSLPDHNLITIKQAYTYIARHGVLWEKLKEKIKLFKQEIKANTIESHSPIQAILFAGNENARKVAASIRQQGFDVRPILSPTVKKGGERIRICLHTFNTDEQIKKLALLLNAP